MRPRARFTVSRFRILGPGDRSAVVEVEGNTPRQLHDAAIKAGAKALACAVEDVTPKYLITRQATHTESYKVRVQLGRERNNANRRNRQWANRLMDQLDAR